MCVSSLVFLVTVQICRMSALAQVLLENLNMTGNMLKNGDNHVKLEVNTSVNTAVPPHTPPVHRLDFLTLIIPFLFLFCLSVVIFMLNLFKASFTSLSSLTRPAYRHTPAPDIQIIEPTRSQAAGLIRQGSCEE